MTLLGVAQWLHHLPGDSQRNRQVGLLPGARVHFHARGGGLDVARAQTLNSQSAHGT